MREILFRGKSNGGIDKWIEGTGVFNDGINTWISFNEPNHAIAYGIKHHIVLPETVGQFTGLTDKNGKKIFEGDIVKHFNASDVGVDIGKVCWDNKYCQFYRTSNSGMYNYRVGADCSYEVVGNIHDDLELMKGGDG